MNSLPTWYSASVDQSPNQFKTHLKYKAFVKMSQKVPLLTVLVIRVGIYSNYLLKSAGEVAALSFRPSEDGFIVNTTWRLRITWLVNHL